ncbi:MAG TPA: DUF721 domain-containing protein [Actinomycetota bacterium]
MGREPAEPAPLGELMRKLIAGRGWGEQLALGRLRDGWVAVVGALVAERSEPARLTGGVLTVRAEPGAWASEMVLLAAAVARKADEFLGGGMVREVKVSTGPVGIASDRL